MIHFFLSLNREQAAHVPKKQGEHVHRLGILELPNIYSVNK